jgi:flagellar protein FliO/FliZ
MCSLPHGLAVLAAATQDATGLNAPALPSYGGLLLRTVIALGVVVALAYVALRYGLPRLMPGLRSAGGPLRIVARQALDTRRQVVIVEACGRYLLLGVAEGSVTLLTEIAPEAVAEAQARPEAQPPRRFADVLKAALGRKPPPESHG